jgi:hypothetical protein
MVDGMRLIDQRAVSFPGTAPVVNDFFGVVDGEWRVYVGRPSVPGGDAFALAFNHQDGGDGSGEAFGHSASPCPGR